MKSADNNAFKCYITRWISAIYFCKCLQKHGPHIPNTKNGYGCYKTTMEFTAPPHRKCPYSIMDSFPIAKHYFHHQEKIQHMWTAHCFCAGPSQCHVRLYVREVGWVLETVVMTCLTSRYLDVKYVSRSIQTFIASLILLFATCHPCGIKESDTPDLYQALN